MARLKLALYQNDGAAGDKDAQLRALVRAAERAAGAGADLVITPELFMAGYNIGDRAHDLAEPCGGPFLKAVSGIARDRATAILCGYAERDGDRLYNSAALIDKQGRLQLNYRKLHASGAYEKATYALGDEIMTFAIKGVTVAPLICYDIEYPEAARAAVVKGADVLCVPTALRAQYAHLADSMIPTRAFENGCFVAYVNHAGSEGDFAYCGLSRLVGPDGSIVSAEGAGEELVIADADTDRIRAARAELPYLEDLRPELFSPPGR
ncbi:MAG: carbon-nitrogen hydrolase family protein [Hyphomicrobiales bacterium]